MTVYPTLQQAREYVERCQRSPLVPAFDALQERDGIEYEFWMDGAGHVSRRAWQELRWEMRVRGCPTARLTGVGVGDDAHLVAFLFHPDGQPKFQLRWLASPGFGMWELVCEYLPIA